jgi:putative transposase
MGWLKLLMALARGSLVNRAALVAENLALRQQLAVLNRTAPRPLLQTRDRCFWAVLSWLFTGWPSWLVIVQPATVVRWHQKGFRLFWRWKSSARRGRPPADREIRDLIRRMNRENATWGAPRITSELRLLGCTVAESTVAKYMHRPRRPPSQTWRTFLTNHVGSLASVDFFTVPTITFQILFVFVVLRHDRRRVVHVNVTAHPTAVWVAQQLREAFPFDEAPRYLIRDRDSIYGEEVRRTIRNLGIEEVVTAPRSPWQNPFVERLIGSIRRECLDHVIVLNARHLRRILSAYLDYYNTCRPHLSLERNSPAPRQVEPSDRGHVVAVPQVGGLHHRYQRVA